ncbi:hypothetical protein KPH14_008276 [Odynerus spinipes]|uniref:Kinesin motor domain-containing protein n=1 Tax=Odynerus spinipes TaxID=1348599 RepID=A0AAD9RGM2_9HYME|nr:hypothetical protein KPH14_008276 [Odynerus spinipes]
MSDSIKVAIKVRPLIKREKDDNLPIQWTVQGNYIASTDSEIKKRGDGGFHFDHIFDERTNNKNVFDIVVKPIVDAAVNGFNGTVFAYGQTSSGKTYTMMGALNEPGIIPLAVEYMFDAIANTMRREFLLRVSYLEIYNERVNDLLNKSGTDLKLHEDVNGQIIIKCKEEVTNSPEHVLSIMKKGDKNRRIGETNMNERSSRSHTIFRITIESRESDADSDGAIQVSQLNLVDLAGSERARQTGATGERFKEGRHINMSLSALGLVIMQLSESQETQKYVNFRDSKLTRLLQASLGGNAMTAIICAITPAALEESQCTLSFASRAKSVKNKPQINEVMSDATLLKRYAKQIAKLNAELEKMKQENRTAEEMEYKLHEKDQANQMLEERIELLKTKIVSGDNTNIEESFKCRSRRRRTWGGPATFKQNSSIFQPSLDLPTIKEMSPEKPCRKSIMQSVNLMNQTFQTAFADFELELIKDERDRENEEDSDEEMFITKRKNRNHVTFMDDVHIYKPDYDIYERTPEKKSTSCQTVNNNQESPGTPKNILKERLHYLKQEFNELREYTTLEKQMYIENHQCVITTEEQKIFELEEQIKNLITAKTEQAEQIISLEKQVIELSSAKTKIRHSTIEPYKTSEENEGQIEESNNLDNFAPTSNDKFDNIVMTDKLQEKLEEKQKEIQQVSDLQQQIKDTTSENSRLKNLVSEILKYATSTNNTSTQMDLLDNTLQPVNEVISDLSSKEIETEYVLSKLQDKIMESIKQHEMQTSEKMSELDKQMLCLKSENAALKEKITCLQQKMDDELKSQQNTSCKENTITNLLKTDLKEELEEEIFEKSKNLQSVVEMGKQLIEFSPIKSRRSLRQSKSNNECETNDLIGYKENTETPLVIEEKVINDSFDISTDAELFVDAQEEIEKAENLILDVSKYKSSPTLKSTDVKEMLHSSLNNFDFEAILSLLHVYLNKIEKCEILELDKLMEMFTSQKHELQYVLNELNKKNIEIDYSHIKNFINESVNLKGLLQDLEVFIKCIVAENNGMKGQLHKESIVLSGRLNNNIDNEEFATDLDMKTQELHEIKNDVIGLKLDMKELQRNIFLLTTENVELLAKLTTEKEEARKIKASYQETVDELSEEISKIKDEKMDLFNENLILNEQVNCLKSHIKNVEEDQFCLSCQNKINKSTVKIVESFYTSVEEPKDRDEHVEDTKNVLLDCSVLEAEVNKISPEDNNERNDKNIEQLQLENNRLKTELLELKEKITVLTEENAKVLKEFPHTLKDNIQNNTGDNPLYISSVFNSTFNDEEEKIKEEKSDILLRKNIALKEQVDHLSQLNKKLAELKTASCVQCAQQKELNESNKVVKLNAKVLAYKLEDMQEKFKRKCADIEVLKNKSNEELYLNICETSLDTSLLDGMNVTSVEEEVSHLNKEIQVLKDDHTKLYLYEEKCNELEKLHNKTVNETDVVPLPEKDTKKKKCRIDKLEKDIDHVKVDIEELKNNVISDLKRSLNEKASLLNEINMLKSVNEELSKVVSHNNLLLETSDKNVKSLENEIINLNAEIENYKMIQEQMQNKKCNLETEMANMKADMEEKEVIIKDLQQIINEYRKENDGLKEDTFCSENFIEENFNVMRHMNKYNLEDESSGEIQKLKDDLNAVRDCITKEIRSLEPKQDVEDLLNKSVDDLFLTFLQIIISKEKEIIDTMQEQFSSDRQRFEDEKQQSIDTENRVTLWAKELETEITKLKNDIATQEAECCELLGKISRTEDLLKESNREKQILTEKIQTLEKDYDNLKSSSEQLEIKIQQEEIITTEHKEIELQVEMIREREEYEQKINNLTSTLETFKIKNLELMQNLESLEISEKDLKNILNTRTDELAKSNENVERIKSEIECLTSAYNKINHETENKNAHIAKLTVEIEDLDKSIESYKIKNMELERQLEELKINEKNVNIALNAKIDELTKSSQNIERMKTEMEHLMNTCDGLNHDIQNKNAHIVEITALLQNKSDTLSEYKTKLETIVPELELLKKQLEEQKLMTNKYKTELECLKADSEMQLTNIKDALSLESVKCAEVNKQLTDLNNKNISLLTELDTLKEQCRELEQKNMKLEQKIRNSVSKIKTETQIEDLQEQNKALQSNLEGAYNCIAELKDKKNHLLEELVNIKKQNESLLEENIKMNDLLSDKAKQNNSNLHTLQEQYSALLNEKSNVILKLEENKMLLCQKEQDLKHCVNQLEELRQKNKELDEEAEELVRENKLLTEKIYSYFDDNNSESKLRSEINTLKEENQKLQIKLTTFDIIKNPDGRQEIFQQKEHASKEVNDDKCINIKKQIQDLELELVSKNGRIAALELQIQSENFPYKKKCKDLEENILAFRNKNVQLEGEIKKLRHALNDINMKECSICKNRYINTKDQYVQTISDSRIQFCGISSGIIEEHLQVQKLEKEKALMKQLCRSRARRVKELEEKVREFENAKILSEETNVALKENIYYPTSRSDKDQTKKKS